MATALQIFYWVRFCISLGVYFKFLWTQLEKLGGISFGNQHPDSSHYILHQDFDTVHHGKGCRWLFMAIFYSRELQRNEKSTFIYEVTAWYLFLFITKSNVNRFSRFPFVDDSRSPLNEICTLLTVPLAYLWVVMLLNFDNIFLIAAMNIKSHFEILQHKFRSEGFDSVKSGMSLRGLIQYHIMLSLESFLAVSFFFFPTYFFFFK